MSSANGSPPRVGERRQKMRAVLHLVSGEKMEESGAAGGAAPRRPPRQAGAASGTGEVGEEVMDVEAVLDQCYSFSASEGLKNAFQSLNSELQIRYDVHMVL